MPKLKTHLASLAGAALLVAASGGAMAQDWPERPITLIVPVGTGGVVDIVGRMVAPELSEKLGQPVVVENRAGGGGMIGTGAVANAEPDGYTLLWSPAGFAAGPALYPDIAYDIFADFTPISQVGRMNLVALVHPEVPSQTVGELITYSKENPDLLNYGTWTPALTLVIEYFKMVTGAQMTGINYKGSGEGLLDFYAGRFQVFFDTTLNGKSKIDEGQARALFVTGGERSPILPEVPTLKEEGYPDFNIYTWMALLAPAGTPDPVIEKVQSALFEVLADADLRAEIEKLGVEVVASDGPALMDLVKSDLDTWQEVLSQVSIEVN